MYPDNDTGQEQNPPTTPPAPATPPVPLPPPSIQPQPPVAPTPPPVPPKKRSRGFRVLVVVLIIYFIWSIVSLFTVAYKSGEEGTALSLNEVLYYVLSTLITPAIVIGFYFVWKSFIASTRQHPADSQQPKAESSVRRAIGLTVCLLAILLPVYFIYNFFANPGPGSEFFVFGLPIFAVPIIYGLLGLKRLAQPPTVAGAPVAAPSPSRRIGSQIINGIVYSLVAIIVAACLWIGYGFYQMRQYAAQDSKPREVSLEVALDTISTCYYIDIKQSKKADPSKGIIFHPQDGVHEVYDDAAWPQLVAAAQKVSGSPINEYGDTCPAAKIKPRK